jgi:hypothetical protein
VRVISRCLLPAAAAAITVALSTGTAHAAGLDVTSTTPTGATTTTSLTWDITTTDSTPTSCELQRGAVVVDPLTDCGPSVSYDVSGQPSGTYTLVVDNDTAAAVAGGATPETVSNSVDVATPTPGPALRPPAVSPDNDRTPKWDLGLPTGTTATCTVTDVDDNVVDSADPCPDPFTAHLGATAASGVYTLTVVATDGGIPSAPAQSAYTLDVSPPAAPAVSAPASNPDNDRTPTFGVSGVEAGATVACTATGPSGPVPLNSCTTTAATLDLTGPGVVDGDYTLSVVATDAVGNVGSAGTATYTLDITPPTTPTLTPPTSPDTDRTPSFGVAEPDAGVTYTCTVTGPAAVVPVSSCGPTTTLDLAGLPDGIYHLKVVVKDAVGNKVTVTADYELDTTAPTTPVVTGSHGPGRDRTPAFTLTEPDADATLTCAVSGPSAATVTVCGSSIVLDLPGPNDGDYVITVTATDPLGNSSSTTFTYTLDTSAPPAPTVGSLPSTVATKKVTAAISDAEAGVRLTCVLTDDLGAIVSSGLCPADGVFDTTGHTDGLFTLVVTAHDTAGNAASTTVTWTRDTTAPPAPTVTPPGSPTKLKQPVVGISDAEPTAGLSCLLTGPLGETVFSGACPVSGSFDTRPYGDGLYTLVVTASDSVGNSSATTVSWTRDTAAPPAPSVSPPGSPTKVKQPSVSVSDAEAGVTLTCVLTGPLGESVFSGVCPGSFDTRPYGDGVYTLVVTATDAAGNASSTTVSWTRDTVAPPAPSVSAPPVLTNSRTVTLAISDAEPGVTLTCVLTGPLGGTVLSGACPGSGVFDTTGHAEGLYTLVVTATDAAGNSSSTTVSWTRDTVAPPAPSVSAPPALTKSTSVTLTISDAEPGVTLTCVLTGPLGETVFSGACPGSGVFSTAGHTDGTYSLLVTATDPAGNSSTTTVTWNRDTAAPPAPTVTPPASPAQGRSPSFTVSDTESPVTWSCSVSGPSAVAVAVCGPTTTLDLTGALDGTYTVTVIAIDPAGNPSAPTQASYVLDTTAPPAPSVSAPPALTKSRTVTLTITDGQPSAVLTCVLTSPAGLTVASGLCPADGVFDTTGFTDGVYTLVVTATDSAGNASTTTVSWTRDTKAPVAPVVKAPKSPAQGRLPVFTVTDAESPVTWTCSVTGPSVVTVTVCGPSATLDLSGALDGVYTLTVTATDPAGNTSLGGSATYTLDTTAPPAPTVTAPGSPASNRGPSFTVTDTEAGVKWACSVTGPSAVTILVCGPTTTVDLSSALDGVYTLSVVAIDAAGNTSPAGTATYTLDTTAPPAPVIGMPPSPNNDLVPVFAITDTENGVRLTCLVTSPAGRTVFSGTCPADGRFDTNGFADGLYTLVVTATDAAGNASSTTVTWVRDIVAPPAPVVVGPARSPAQNRSPAFTVTDTEAGVRFACTVTGPSTVTVSVCGAISRLDLTGALDGVYTLTVTAIDAAGNVSGSDSASYTLDTTPPATPNVGVNGSPAQGRHPTFTITGIEAGGTLTCTLSGPTGSTATVPGACSDTVPLDLSGQPDGIYTVFVTVTDSAGNTSAAGSASYTLDTTPPAAPDVTPPTSPDNDRTPTFVIDGEPGATLTCTVARYFQIVSTGLCPADGVISLVGLDDGEFEITVVATDAAGNTGPETTVVYLLDTTPPAAVVLTAPASPSPIEQPVWLWTAEAGTTAVCTVTATDGTVVQGPVACSSPFTGAFRRLADGTYMLTVVVTDAAGNSSPPATSAFILDRRAPVPPTVVPPRSPDNTHHPKWLISGPRGAVLTCTLLSGRTVVLGPMDCPSDGIFSLAGLPDGTYTLRVTATDRAGNVSAASVTTYVLDTTPPRAPRLDYHSPTPSANTSPFWGFTLPAGTTGRCVLMHNGSVIASRNKCTGAVKFDLAGRPTGVYTVQIYAVDAAGNQSKPLVVTYVLGNKPPTPGPPPPPPPPTGPTGSGGGGHHPGGNKPGTGPTGPGGAVQHVIDRITQVGSILHNGGKKAVRDVGQAAGAVLPFIHDRFTEDVSSAVQGVVDTLSHAGGGTSFPLLLLMIVVLFLLVQNRIDRRDPKLALASVAADDTVEFRPPPSRGADR